MKRSASSSSSSPSPPSKSPLSKAKRFRRSGVIIKEVTGNLFDSPETESLAHCVSRCLKMGQGIAVDFKQKFGSVDELKEQDKGVGDVAILERDGRFIYYLITKEKYWEKPTYGNVERSLQSMRDHCVANNVKTLSIPRIGCGLDRLKWERIREMIENVFQKTEMVITIYEYVNE